jgi:hypothetical protein
MENQNTPNSDPVNPPVNNTPAQNPTPPTSAPKKGLNWKGFLLALVIVGLLDWGALTVLHSENNPKIVPPTAPTATPNPTANWKTYTSTHYPFTFKYPSRFQPETRHGSDTSQETITATTNHEIANFMKATPHGYFNINLYPRNGTFEKIIDRNEDDLVKYTYKYGFKREDITISGIQVRKISAYHLPNNTGTLCAI